MVSIKSAVRDLPNLPRGKPVTVKDVAESATVAFHAFCVTARTLVQKSAISDFSINLNEFPVIPCLAMLVGYVLASLHMSFIVWPIFFVVFGAACVHVSSVSRLRTTADSTGELAEAKSQTKKNLVKAVSNQTTSIKSDVEAEISSSSGSSHEKEPVFCCISLVSFTLNLTEAKPHDAKNGSDNLLDSLDKKERSDKATSDHNASTKSKLDLETSPSSDSGEEEGSDQRISSVSSTVNLYEAKLRGARSAPDKPNSCQSLSLSSHDRNERSVKESSSHKASIKSDIDAETCHSSAEPVKCACSVSPPQTTPDSTVSLAEAKPQVARSGPDNKPYTIHHRTDKKVTVKNNTESVIQVDTTKYNSPDVGSYASFEVQPCSSNVWDLESSWEVVGIKSGDKTMGLYVPTGSDITVYRLEISIPRQFDVRKGLRVQGYARNFISVINSSGRDIKVLVAKQSNKRENEVWFKLEDKKVSAWDRNSHEMVVVEQDSIRVWVYVNVGSRVEFLGL